MKRFLTPRGRRSLMVFGLIELAVIAAAYGISEIVRGLGFLTLLPFGLTGCALGWVLAKGKSHGALRSGAALILGIMISFSIIGRLGSQFGDLLFIVRSMDWGRMLTDGADWTQFLDSFNQLMDALLVLSGRIQSWIQLLTHGTPIYDPIVTSMMWTLSLWMSALALGWWMNQKRTPLLAFGPILLLLTYGLSITGGNPNLTLPILGPMLYLMVLSSHEFDDGPQISIPTRVEPTLQPIVRRSGLLITIGLIVMAALIPTLSLRTIQHHLTTLMNSLTDRGSTSLALGLRPVPEPEAQNPLATMQSGGLPVNHLVGSPPELEDHVALEFRVQVEPHLGISPQPANLYWRVVTYDRYNGRGWSTSSIRTQTYQAGEVITPTTDERKLRMQASVRVFHEPGGLLFHPGMLVSVDDEYSVSWRTQAAPFGRADPFGATVTSSDYQATTLLPIYGAEELKEAGQVYPTEMLERYTHLPQAVPDHVLELANKLTATQPTPYDRAVAIESYLRSFPYTLDVPPLPLGVEISEYFLFDLQQGYCDYFATSMVVLARAAGLPTRLVVGYIGGLYDEPRDLYQVTEDRAHSWVEIFFPGYGWIEFEPTAGRPPIERSLEAETFPQPVPDDPLLATIDQESNWFAILVWTILTTVSILIGGWFVWAGLDSFYLRSLHPDKATRRLFKRLLWVSRWLEVPVRPADSPFEITKNLESHLNARLPQQLHNLGRSTISQEVNSICLAYVHLRYGPPSPPHQRSKDLLRSWPGIRWRLFYLVLYHRLVKLFQLRRILPSKL